jgi:hypothetical protein
VASSDVTGVDFTGTKDPNCNGGTTYNISGKVTDSSGAGISGVEVSAGSNPATTGSNGSYTISGLTGNNTVTPSKSGYTFSPASQPVSAARTDVNFTGSTTPPPGGDITGQIRVQGRADNGDKVVFYGSSQPCSGFTRSESDKLSNATIGTDGKFSIKLSSPINCLLIYRPGHLIGQRSNPSGDLGYLVLTAGDVTPIKSGGDNQINITDLSLIAANYGKADPTGGLIDFDGNGQISITDISIVAGNYSEKGNVDNWY